MSSSSDEDALIDEEEKVKRSFSAYKWPLVASLAVELLWCSSLSSWLRVNDIRYAGGGFVRGEEERIEEGVSHDVHDVVPKCWCVFVLCLSARACVFFAWQKHCWRLADSTFSGLYMFFSSIQWPIYVFCYYVLLNNISEMKATPEVQVSSPSEVFHDMILSNKTARMDGTTTMFMPDCLKFYSPTECVSRINLEVHCNQEFDPYQCSGYTRIGHQQGSVKCCVKTKFSVYVPSEIVPPTGYSMSTLASLFTVLSTLAIWWAMNNTPMLPSWGTAASFTSGVWLDIMDSVTFLQTYATNKAIINPKHGITADGSACQVSLIMYRAVMSTAFIAFISSILAPIVYTLCRKTNKEDVVSSGRTVDETLANAADCVRLLDIEQAGKLVSEAVELQQEQYWKESEGKSEEISVLVFPEDSVFDTSPSRKHLSSSISALSPEDEARPAVALRQQHGFYNVEYTDNQEPASETNIPVHRLRPDMQVSHEACGPQCCTGWCHPRQLYGADEQQQFDHRVAFFEALRSLLLLELPFLCWRFWFEHAGLNAFSFAWVLMLKNVVWGLIDAMTILGFGSTAGTCLGHVPAQFLDRTVNGTSLSGMMLMGEGGVVLIGHQLLQKAVHARIQKKTEVMQSQRAWLLVERSKALHEGDQAAIELYDKNAKELQQLIDDELNKKSMRVM